MKTICCQINRNAMRHASQHCSNGFNLGKFTLQNRNIAVEIARASKEKRNRVIESKQIGARRRIDFCEIADTFARRRTETTKRNEPFRARHRSLPPKENHRKGANRGRKTPTRRMKSKFSSRKLIIYVTLVIVLHICPIRAVSRRPIGLNLIFRVQCT